MSIFLVRTPVRNWITAKECLVFVYE